jgi:hypothetical protein
MVGFIQQHIAGRPLSPAVWRRLLPPGYPDTEFLLYVLEHGLVVVPPGTEVPPATCHNYASTREQAHLVEKQLREELAARQLLRAPDSAAVSHIHALAAIPKSAEEVRVIHDLSRPKGQAINDYITYKQYTWASLDDALRLVHPGYFMARVDIRQYYRHIPVDPADWPLLAFRWHFTGEAGATTLLDPYLQFGQRNAPEVAHRFTLAILAMMRARGFHNLVGVMDDFLVVESTEEACRRTWQALLDLLAELGFQANTKPGKTDPPSQLVKFLGVLIDSSNMQVRLCPAKLAGLQERLARCSRSITKRELQSLAGLLTWASKVVYGGRTFMRRILDATNSPGPPSTHIKLGAAARADVQWWRTYLPRFNGVAVILPAQATAPKEFQTDAESTGAIGAFLWGGYVGLTHEQQLACFPGAYVPPQGLHISVYETFAVLAAARVFPDALRNTYVCVRSDNTQTVAAIRKLTCGASKVNKEHIMRILRELFGLSVSLNFRITATHIPGYQNVMADALSRGQYDRFTTLLHKWRAT